MPNGVKLRKGEREALSRPSGEEVRAREEFKFEERVKKLDNSLKNGKKRFNKKKRFSIF